LPVLTPPSVSPDDPLLLCLDMQPALIGAVADGAAILRRCEFAVAAAAGIGLPVAFTEQVPQKLGPTAPALLALAPRASVWSKQAFSALGDEGIRQALIEQRGVRHLLLCGIETSICVYQTAVAALAEDILVTILSDCVSARRTADATACLAALARHGAHVLPSETVFYSLLRDTAHPNFRDFTRLVKAHSAASAPLPPASSAHA
jgi:nicotinamidase-related amidase